MTLDARLAIVFVALMSLFPYAILRGRARNVYGFADAASYALFAALWFLSPLLGIAMSESLVFALVVVVKLAIFAIVLSAAPEGIGPNFGAVFAAAVYLLFVPHVLQWPIDGDEPFYLLVTESIVEDRDLDLANQYRDLETSVVGRTDLQPQWGDPVGSRGEQYSRHEPFLSILLVPGFLIAGLHGAVVTIALFGALLVRSLLLLLEEEGISARTRGLLFPLIAFGPPVVSYATRIWPEVPAAFFLTEALRASRGGRKWWLAASLLALSLLKLRFIPIAVALIAIDFVRRRDRRTALIVVASLAVPFVIVALISGSIFNVHAARELLPGHPLKYLRGAFGLILDAQTGLLFQAPVWCLGVFALLRWKELPAVIRIGALAAIPYIVLLLPRDEWHGGWAPPGRYLVVFAPLFACGAGFVIERVRGATIALVALWSAALATYGIAFPWRLFHIANGESVFGEWLSQMYESDFSRVLPSFIRPNAAAVIASAVLVAAILLVRLRDRVGMRLPSHVGVAIVAMIIAGGFVMARRPAARVDFEDAHVVHDGGELFPHKWTVARFRFRGGWTLRAGDAVSFAMRRGVSTMHYKASSSARLRIHDREVIVPPTGEEWRETRVTVPDVERVRVECVSGEITLDRIVHE